MNFKRLLFLCDYPPSTLAGAPIIVKQLLRNYDMDKLHVMCCQKMYEVNDLIRSSYLTCRHTLIPSLRVIDPRPRRVFGPVMASIECLRAYRILREARRVILEEEIQLLFTVPHRCEFSLAAYFLHRELGLPLYVFETDDWGASNPRLLPNYLIHRYRERFLRAAAKLWLISPAMVRDFRERFGVEGDFLFHFVPIEKYIAAADRAVPRGASGPISVVYTGSINNTFRDTIEAFCRLLNDGMNVGGRPVELTIHSHYVPPHFLGPHVGFGGFVPSEAIPDILARADILFIGISFTEDPALRQLIRTNIYTKTVDYLASTRPVLVISPPDSGEVDYFGTVTTVIHSLERPVVEEAVGRLVNDGEYVREISRRGVELVRERHSMESLQGSFLSHFADTSS